MIDLAETTRTPAITEPGARAAGVFDAAALWLYGESMGDLLGEFGESLPGLADPWIDTPVNWLFRRETLPTWLGPVLMGDRPPIGLLVGEHVAALRRVLALERICARHFDFRSDGTGVYRERAEIGGGGFDQHSRERILELTRRLGLVTPATPRYRSYDHTIVLGGGYRSPLLRTQLAERLRVERIDLGEVAWLGSPRTLFVPDPQKAEQQQRPEHVVTDEYAPGATDEFDLMVAAARTVMGAKPGDVELLCGCTSTDVYCPRWTAPTDGCDQPPPEYTHERRVPLSGHSGWHGAGLSASTTRPPDRPDTVDTLRLWGRLAKPHPGQPVLVITDQVFVPFQSFDCARALFLPYGVSLDYAGLSAMAGGRPATAEYLLQETLSAVRSARRLLTAAADALRALS